MSEPVLSVSMLIGQKVRGRWQRALKPWARMFDLRRRDERKLAATSPPLVCLRVNGGLERGRSQETGGGSHRYSSHAQKKGLSLQIGSMPSALLAVAHEPETSTPPALGAPSDREQRFRLILRHQSSANQGPRARLRWPRDYPKSLQYHALRPLNYRIAVTTFTGPAAFVEWPPQVCDRYPTAHHPARAKALPSRIHLSAL